ncbi:MAG: toll/interleukin-1 receptor domain-containing protein [Caulobacteraceae bacterium]
MAHDVFISYSSQDKPVADRVCHALEEKGLRCWVAPRDIPYGAEWPEAIMGALASAPAVVLVFTHHTNNSAHVRREVAAALEAGAIVIPFRTEEATPEGALRYNLINLHWMDAISPPLEAHIDGLIRTLKRLEGEPAGTPSPVAAPAPRSGMAAEHPAGSRAEPPPPAGEPTLDRRFELVVGLAAILAALGWFSPLWILSLPVTVPLIWRANWTKTSPTRRPSRRLRLLASMAVFMIAIGAIAAAGPH